MNYEKTPIKNNIKDAAKKSVHNDMDRLSTSAILWHVVKRHKFGLVVTYAVVLSVLYFVPFAPDMLTDILSSIF